MRKQPKYLRENKLLNNKHILLCDTKLQHQELDYIKTNFCGRVFDMDKFNTNKCSSDTIVYLCGNIGEIFNQIDFAMIQIINVVKDFSENYLDIDTEKYRLINSGAVPINVHGMGIYFRRLFDSDKDYYNLIVNEHKFQSLTESNKPGSAFRKGIYLTKVEIQNNEVKEIDDIKDNEIKDNEVKDNDELKFKLLRCSTNFSDATGNFGETDKHIIKEVDEASKPYFKEPAELNHVLAQIYVNSIVLDENNNKKKEVKAKIKRHSDKTKDMPRNALIAFTTFYKNYIKDQFNNETVKYNKSNTDEYDICYKNTSVLTRLRFRLKKDVVSENMEKQFDVVLYPNSVFIINLTTNRLYTHEIVPSTLPVEKLPTRLGYVIRCSSCEASFKDNQTYIHQYGKKFKLEPPTEKDIKVLKELYLKENTTSEMVNYDGLHFSLNESDYIKPIL